MNKLLWKVCGMRDSNNIRALLEESPDFMGFIFFEKSPRNASNKLDRQLLLNFPARTKKVGVFVNESVENILQKVNDYQLDYVQLHGDESPEFCQKLKQQQLKLFKAFGVNEEFDFATLQPYQEAIDYFLFDTKGKNYGGNGIPFDWKKLEEYPLDKPFLLSGGIDLENIREVNHIPSSRLAGIDVNSKFELTPGYKNIDLIKKLKSELSNDKSA
ncbi:phosphoribosylanthranilate isomerase [Rapidithrix thailandica]|uniref:N-(5'-phosphoribosyl)anthranilate isomerase n=1 Tax=Rapidithrix thailandica TaxID=413964 RepID=A0AAW9SDC1_9BACT